MIISKQMGNPDFKMLIFSDFLPFDLIMDMLDTFGLKYSQVVGTISRNQ